MKNIFVFGIGGTGARIVRAMTMMLASGVTFEENPTIIPIIIDVDVENEDTNRAMKAMDLYKKIRSEGYAPKSVVSEGFFATELNTLGARKEDVKDSFQLKFAGISESFEDYLKVNEMDTIDEQFLKLLYDASPKENSDTELKLELTKGFKGNPNIGCIVFNDLVNTEEYKHFESVMGENDRIFIISSIFGGTGSAGFPQLLKLIRNSRNQLVRNAKIGAVTVMPYYAVKDKTGSAIKSARFASKTKAALSYYENEMEGLDAIYYIYDKAGNMPYENNEGGKPQRNNAHMVELIAATSVFHFIRKKDTSFEPAQKYYEFGIKKDISPVNIGHFFSRTKNTVLHPLTLFTYAMKIYLEYLPSVKKEAFATGLDLTRELNQNIYYQNLTAFFRDHYKAWLEEMENNDRTFRPFNLKGELNSMVVGQPVNTSFFNSGLSNAHLEKIMGAIQDSLSATIPENERRFMKMMNETAKKCFEKLESLPAMA